MKPGLLKIPDPSFPDTDDPCIAKTEKSGGHLVIFGLVKEGMSMVGAMECFGTRNSKTSMLASADCGQL